MKLLNLSFELQVASYELPLVLLVSYFAFTVFDASAQPLHNFSMNRQATSTGVYNKPARRI